MTVYLKLKLTFDINTSVSRGAAEVTPSPERQRAQVLALGKEFLTPGSIHSNVGNPNSGGQAWCQGFSPLKKDPF